MMATLAASAGDANIADDAADPATGDEDSEALCPDSIKLVEEIVVVLKVAQLVGMIRVLLEHRVGRARHDRCTDSLLMNERSRASPCIRRCRVGPPLGASVSGTPESYWRNP